MKHNPERHHRRSIRLRGYDYSQVEVYLVTICTQNRLCLFGDIVDGEMVLNDAGRMVETVWHGLPNHYPHVQLDQSVIMPNHFHGIIALVDGVGAGFKPAPTGAPAKNSRHGLPEIVRGFKTFTARRINELRNTPGTSIWQRNYYEHIIRNEQLLDRIREYIANNLLQWELDLENPNVVGAGLKPAPTKDDPWRI